jgi:PhnB protein
MTVRPIPEGHNAVCPYITVPGVARLIDFLKATFDAQELFRMPGPNGTVGHAELRIIDSIVMLGEPMGGDYKPLPAQMHCYVPDVDATFAKALANGATVMRPPTDMFYGDRISMVRDAWGNIWAISTHKEDVTPDELQRRMAAQKK